MSLVLSKLALGLVVSFAAACQGSLLDGSRADIAAQEANPSQSSGRSHIVTAIVRDDLDEAASLSLTLQSDHIVTTAVYTDGQGDVDNALRVARQILKDNPGDKVEILFVKTPVDAPKPYPAGTLPFSQEARTQLAAQGITFVDRPTLQDYESIVFSPVPHRGLDHVNIKADVVAVLTEYNLKADLDDVGRDHFNQFLKPYGNLHILPGGIGGGARGVLQPDLSGVPELDAATAALGVPRLVPGHYFFGYASREIVAEKVKRYGGNTEDFRTYSQALFMATALQNHPEVKSFVLPGDLTETDRKDIVRLIGELGEFDSSKIKLTLREVLPTGGIQVHHEDPVDGEMRIEIVTGRLPHEHFLSLLRHSHDYALVTGDQSLVEAANLGKLAVYQVRLHKFELVVAIQETLNAKFDKLGDLFINCCTIMPSGFEFDEEALKKQYGARYRELDWDKLRKVVAGNPIRSLDWQMLAEHNDLLHEGLREVFARDLFADVAAEIKAVKAKKQPQKAKPTPMQDAAKRRG